MVVSSDDEQPGGMKTRWRLRVNQAPCLDADHWPVLGERGSVAFRKTGAASGIAVYRRGHVSGVWRCAAIFGAALIGPIALSGAQAQSASLLGVQARFATSEPDRIAGTLHLIKPGSAEAVRAGPREKVSGESSTLGPAIGRTRTGGTTPWEPGTWEPRTWEPETDETGECVTRSRKQASGAAVVARETIASGTGKSGRWGWLPDHSNNNARTTRIGVGDTDNTLVAISPDKESAFDVAASPSPGAIKTGPAARNRFSDEFVDKGAEDSPSRDPSSDRPLPGHLAPDHASEPGPNIEADLVVTAHRRPQNRNELNLSVSVLSAETLDRIQADHPSEALNRLAGVNIQRGNGVEHLTAIRSPVLTAGAGAGSFLFLEDNVPLRSAGFANVNGLAEAHTEIARRIEVVKGPAGAQYGANAIHGVVNVISPHAPARGSLAQVTLSADNDGRLKGEAILGTRIAGNRPGADQGVTLALSLGHEDGFEEPSGLDQQKLSVIWALDRANWRARTTLAFVNIDQETAGFIQGDDAYRDRELRAINPVPEAYRDAQSARLQTAFELDLTPKITLAITPFLRWNEQDFLLSFLPSRARERNGHWSIGEQAALDWHSALGLVWTFGFDSEYTEGYLTEFQSRPTIGSFTNGLHYDYSVRAISASPFVQLEIPLARRWRAELAARLDWTFYDYDNRTLNNDIGRFRRPADARDAFRTISPKLGLVYEWSPSQQFYARLAQGARPPQTSDLYRLQTQQRFGGIRPERITNLELGWRAHWPLLTLDLAAFGARKSRFYFRDADGFNVPDGRTQHIGVEIEGELRLPQGFVAAASGTYARHTYRFTRLVRGDQSETILAGSDIDTAPRTLANVALSWRSDRGAQAGNLEPSSEPDSARKAGPYWEWELEWVHEGRYFTDAANRNLYPGHNLGNFRVQWHLTGGLAAGFTIRNLAGKLYAERADFAFQTERFFPGERRVFAFNLRWDLAHP